MVVDIGLAPSSLEMVLGLRHRPDMLAPGNARAVGRGRRTDADATSVRPPQDASVESRSSSIRAAAMSLHNVTPGARAPNEFNVIIEIPMSADPIKYEVDEESGALFVDRFMATSMHYPCNYGYIPQTLAADGDPVDVLVVTPVPLISGVVVTCRPLGLLRMDDEAGGDNKLLAVPIDRILSIYTQWTKPEDLNPMRLKTIQHFFEHYKDLEAGKWVKILGWDGPEAARAEVAGGISNWRKSHGLAG
jgi:inorganic pyrophosphatase